MKPFTLPRKKTLKSVGLRKRPSKWIFTKTDVCKNAVDQCERTKTEKYKNTATATTEVQNRWRQFKSKESHEKIENERPVLKTSCRLSEYYLGNNKITPAGCIEQGERNAELLWVARVSFRSKEVLRNYGYQGDFGYGLVAQTCGGKT